VKTAVLLAVAAACMPAAASAQYVHSAQSPAYLLIPSPALDFTTLSATATPAGYVTARQTLRGDTNTFAVNNARLTLMAKPVPIAAFRLQANIALLDSTVVGLNPPVFTPGFLLTDAYVQLSPPESSTTNLRWRPAFLIGQFKTPFALEFLTAFSTLYTANRSMAVDSLGTRRDIGVMGQVQGWDRVVLAAAVTNGAGSNNPRTFTGQEMVIGRLTVHPFPRTLAVAGKWLGWGGDHRWGADVRWFSDPNLGPRSVILEGEWLRRTGAVDFTALPTDGSGGYGLAVWRALPWLEPVLKWERLRESHTTPTTFIEHTATTMTYGAVLRTPEAAEHLRVQVNYIATHARPVPTNNELLTQFILIY
jgi:hypothetical protein